MHRRSPTRPPSDTVWDFAGETMGTTWSVRLVPPSDGDRDCLLEAITGELTKQVALFSHWEAASELSRFNAAVAGPVEVSAEFLDLIAHSLRMAEVTGGAVDPTLGALVDLWGFGPPGQRPAGDLPGAAEIDAARAVSGWMGLNLNRAASLLHQPGGLRLDLSGLAKGRAVDRVSANLTALGAAHHLVEIGGELRGRGVKPDGQPWWVEIERREHAGPPVRAALFDLAVATSGDAERAFEADGRRFGHTLDGRTGRPVDPGVAAVTVLADSAFEADAWATALTVMGPDAGLRRADAEGLAAAFVLRRAGGSLERTSAAWRAMAQA